MNAAPPAPRARARVTPRLATRARHSALESRASRHRDDMSSRSIVVVGAGNAAGYLVRALVSHGLGKNVTLIGAEDVAPYERPAPTKGFLHAQNPPRLPGFHTCVGGGGERQTPEWYVEHGVELKLTLRHFAAILRRDMWLSWKVPELVVLDLFRVGQIVVAFLRS